ncbi:DPP IV N-terminal domain-containing protein [Flagellimonas meishanensis]|uniref:DPP IV N-terminal domain-containing protein n=1 Tax=Flagellimonas meishanensis TaxID=2873264 RepID=UPI001CA6856A|nr:DPP IV N-terminal domain-containing protein [[Muricauda] meishanensis]
MKRTGEYTLLLFFLICCPIAMAQETIRELKTNNAYPNLSNDSQLLVFHSDISGNNEIYISDLTLGITKQLTNNPANDRTPSISPDKSKIAFVSTRNGNYDIFLMDIDGKTQRNITNDSLSKDIHPYWFPNGKKLVFNSTARGEDYDIYSYSLVNKTIEKLRTSPGESTHGQISPNGLKMVFRKYFKEIDETNSEIVILDFETGIEQRITNNAAFDSHPIWTNSGNQIIYVSDLDGPEKYHTSIFMYDIKSQYTSQLTKSKDEYRDLTPAFDAINKRVLFTRQSADRSKADVLSIKYY